MTTKMVKRRKTWEVVGGKKGKKDYQEANEVRMRQKEIDGGQTDRRSQAEERARIWLKQPE